MNNWKRDASATDKADIAEATMDIIVNPTLLIAPTDSKIWSVGIHA